MYEDTFVVIYAYYLAVISLKRKHVNNLVVRLARNNLHNWKSGLTIAGSVNE